MEQFPNNEIPNELKEMYAKFVGKFPGMTPADFMEFRNAALSSHPASAKSFTSVGGVMMDHVPDTEEDRELRERPSNE